MKVLLCCSVRLKKLRDTQSVISCTKQLSLYSFFIALESQVLFCSLRSDGHLNYTSAWRHSGKFSRESEESTEHHKIGDIMLSNLLQMKVKYFQIYLKITIGYGKQNANLHSYTINVLLTNIAWTQAGL
jgi:hypothetical protein